MQSGLSLGKTLQFVTGWCLNQVLAPKGLSLHMMAGSLAVSARHSS